jgi:pimeloyl-ACP methyl ester carboxylesterase
VSEVVGSVAQLRAAATSVDDVKIEDLHIQEEISVRTEDGWTLALTRYKPRPQSFPQPLLGVPLLLVHGYTQNRRAWSSGEFVKSMLYFGADLFLLELRGHGKSGIEQQRRAARATGVPPPADLDYLWDLDSHLLFDLPAAIAEVKRVSGRERIFYCGHSLGGILGYAYATLFDDLQGLITIGAPSDFGRLPPWLRLLAWGPVFGFPAIDAVLAAGNLARVTARGLQRLPGLQLPKREFAPWRFRRLPFRAAFRWLEGNLRSSMQAPLTGRLPFSRPLLYQPRNVALGALRPLLREGGNDEPRATLEQLARWARRGELTSPRLRHDIAAAFPRIRIPLAIFFGDEDPLASVRTTRNVYRAVSSEYLLWRPVRGNSHLDLTMGYDIRQICYDVKNLMSYALDHEAGSNSLPRRRRARAG